MLADSTLNLHRHWRRSAAPLAIALALAMTAGTARAEAADDLDTTEQIANAVQEAVAVVADAPADTATFNGALPTSGGGC